MSVLRALLRQTRLRPFYPPSPLFQREFRSCRPLWKRKGLERHPDDVYDLQETDPEGPIRLEEFPDNVLEEQLEDDFADDDTTTLGHMVLQEYRDILYHMRMIEHDMPKLVGKFSLSACLFHQMRML
jgi:hypothetical protein